MGKTAILSVRILGDAKSAQTAMRSTEASAGRLSRLGGLAKGALVGAAAGAGALAVKLGVDAVRSASELEQSVGGVQAVFKGGAGEMLAFSQTAATSVGLSSAEFNRLGTLLGAQLKNGGTSIDQLGAKTTGLVKVGADLSAMFGGSATEAVEAISSALKGERDPIEKYGISLTQAKIDAEAASLGFKKVGGSLSGQAQQAATMSLIMKQSGDATGAFGRETNTLAHQQQVLKAQWTNLTATLGGMFLPVLTKAMTWITSNGVPAVQQFIATLRGANGPPESFAGRLKAAFSQIAPTIAPLIASVRQLAPAIGQALSSAVPAATSALTGLTSAFTFLAQNTGVLKAGLAGLVAAFALHRAGAAASQVVEAARLPITIAQTVATISLAAANRQLAASQTAVSAQTAATTATQTGAVAAENAGVLARARALAGMVAQRVAMVATAVATGAWAAAQWVLNAALTANPIGLVVAAIALLIGGLILAYTKVAWFRNGVNAVWSWLKSTTTSVFNAVRTAVTTALATAAAVGSAALTRLRSLGSSAINGLRSAVSGAINGARSAVTSALATAAAVGSAALARLRSLGSSAINGLRSAVTSALSTVIATVTALPGQIVGALSGLAGQLRTVGTDMIQGLIGGIKAMAGKAVSAVTGVVGGAVEGAKRLLKINSPSRVFMGLGQSTGEGFVLGITREARSVTRAASTMLAIPAAEAPQAPQIALSGSSARARGAAAGQVVNVTVNGALDPLAVARQIHSLLDTHTARMGR